MSHLLCKCHLHPSAGALWAARTQLGAAVAPGSFYELQDSTQFMSRTGQAAARWETTSRSLFAAQQMDKGRMHTECAPKAQTRLSCTWHMLFDSPAHQRAHFLPCDAKEAGGLKAGCSLGAPLYDPGALFPIIPFAVELCKHWWGGDRNIHP